MLTLSAYMKQQAAVQNRAMQPVALLTLSHPSIQTQYFASDVSPVTSNGQVYQAWPFTFQFPGESDVLTTAQIAIQNVSKEIGQAIREIKGDIKAKLAAVLREEPDVVIADYPGLLLRNVTVDNVRITGTLTGRRRTNSAWTGTVASPALCPGLHFT